jgi:hypothetical protein
MSPCLYIHTATALSYLILVCESKDENTSLKIWNVKFRYFRVTIYQLRLTNISPMRNTSWNCIDAQAKIKNLHLKCWDFISLDFLRDSCMRFLSGFFQSNCTFWTPLDTTRPNFVNQQSLWQCWSRIISLTWSRIISLTDSLLWISGLLDFAVMLTKICAKYRNIDPSLIESRKNFVNLEFKLGILILSLLPSPQIYNKCKNCYCFKTMVWDGAKKGETTAEWGIETEYKMFLTYSPIFSTIHNIFNTWETKGEYWTSLNSILKLFIILNKGFDPENISIYRRRWDRSSSLLSMYVRISEYSNKLSEISLNSYYEYCIYQISTSKNKRSEFSL